MAANINIAMYLGQVPSSGKRKTIWETLSLSHLPDESGSASKVLL
ncbi:MAG: hypothetical protein PQJ28_03080 [Spirochaetales bacterium]|nr:hypothetical protein [Spirochaetales bacterium]